MATRLQENLAQEIIKDAESRKQGKKPKNKQELVVSSGYGEVTADRHATSTMRRKGVKEELKKAGFTEEGAKGVVEGIMYDEEVNPATRLQATRQVFEVHGTFAPEKHVVVTKKIVSIDE